MYFMKNNKRFSKLLRDCDLGTQELVFKRGLNITKEPLDLCFEKGLITLSQHQYGIRLRWLYSLRFGAIGISSNFPKDLLSQSQSRDADWLSSKQHEYKTITEKLKSQNVQKIISDICIHNIWPTFLTRPSSIKSRREFENFQQAIEKMEKIFNNYRRIY